MPKPGHEQTEDSVREQLRDRIIDAAFWVFMKMGYAGASTLAIATRAKLSKRELYALFGSKQAMLAACIDRRADRMRVAVDLPLPHDAATFAATLRGFGEAVLREITHPGVTALFRLAVLEAERSPEVARSLGEVRTANHAALAHLLRRGQGAGILHTGDVQAMAAQFLALLRSDFQLLLLLRIEARPAAPDIEHRAATATEAFMRLYSAEKRS